MTRAVIYQRVSDKKQATEDKTSMDDQVRHCEAYAGKQGWSIVGVYSETS